MNFQFICVYVSIMGVNMRQFSRRGDEAAVRKVLKNTMDETYENWRSFKENGNLNKEHLYLESEK